MDEKLLQAVIDGYKNSIHFTEDHSDDTDGDIFGLEFSDRAKELIRLVCKNALEFAQKTFIGFHFDSYNCYALGIDLWLTRNGHGAGFWDGDWPEDVEKKMTNYSKKLGENYVFVYDNAIFFEFDK